MKVTYEFLLNVAMDKKKVIDLINDNYFKLSLKRDFSKFSDYPVHCKQYIYMTVYDLCKIVSIIYNLMNESEKEKFIDSLKIMIG